MSVAVREKVVSGYHTHIYPAKQDMCEAMAQRIREMAHAEVAAHGRFTMTLSGGSTPRGLYSRLAKFSEDEMPWTKTYLFIGDERCVPSDSPESNYGMVRDLLLSHISIPSSNVFPTVEQDRDPDKAGKKYDQTLRRFFHIDEQNAEGKIPVFSLHLMGLGDDGHTASLFPGSPAINVHDVLYTSNYVQKMDSHRLTMTWPLIVNASKIFMMVEGAGKAQIIKQVLTEPQHGFPSQMLMHQLKHKDQLEWYLDESCSTLL